MSGETILAVAALGKLLDDGNFMVSGDLIDYESGNSFGIPQKRGLTAVQAAFLRELEAALKHYSLFETMSKGITCGWVPDAFEVLDRLKTEGILSEEEFQTCKQRRIERITNFDSGR